MTSTEKLPALTSLRFAAAALIVVLHTRGSFGVPQDFWDPFRLDQAVGLFFVLSGFILAYVYPSLRERGTGRFLVARFARVWPAHAAAFALVVLLLPAPLRSTTAELAPEVTFANLALVHGWIPLARYFFSYNAPSWSISTELAFYFCFPLLIHNWRHTWLSKLALTLLLLVGMVALGNRLQLPAMVLDPGEPTLSGVVIINPLARLFEFTLGMATALLWRRVAPALDLDRPLGTLLELVAIGCVGATMYFAEDWAGEAEEWVGPAGAIWLTTGGRSFLSFAGLIFVLALGRGLVSRSLALPALVLLGEISYSVYLVHQVLLRFCATQLGELATVPGWPALPLFWAATLLVSLLLWLAVERPLRRAIVGLWPPPAADAPLARSRMPVSTATE